MNDLIHNMRRPTMAEKQDKPKTNVKIYSPTLAKYNETKL